VWIRPFLKLCNAFPLDPTKPIATRHLIRQIEAGNSLVIFPEGRIATVTGTLMKVYDGAAMVADKTGAKIVPVRIDGLEKSPFSRLNAMQIRKRLFPKVKVTIMPPVELSIDPDLKGRNRRQAAGAELHRIMTDMMFRTSFKTGTILEEVIEAAKEFGEKKIAVTDYVGGSVNTLTYRRILIGTRVLAKRLKSMLPEQDDGAGIPTDRNVGVMLPNANGTVVTFLALISAGKVPSMINFSAGLPALRKSCTAAKITTILTTRTFVSLAKLDETVAGLEAHGVRFVYVDEIRETVTSGEKLAAFVMRRHPLVSRVADDEAVVLFTSRILRFTQGCRPHACEHSRECGAGIVECRLRHERPCVQCASDVP
jgi:acyl-[acyl-carrier-protein]-phospholipid O-acyltransferase/long-chain-fatty-acid--[acyl-carrier-protein] ligase